MAIGDQIKRRVSTGLPTTKIQLRDGLYPATIASIAFFQEDALDKEGRKYVADRVRVAFELHGQKDAEGKPVVLSRKYTASTYAQSAFVEFLSSATGIEATNEEALRAVNEDELIGLAGSVLTKYNAGKGYTNVDRFVVNAK